MEQELKGKIEREFVIHDDELNMTVVFDGRIGRRLIEVDGKYWHSLPAQIKHDAEKDLIAKRNGYTLTRIPI